MTSRLGWFAALIASAAALCLASACGSSAESAATDFDRDAGADGSSKSDAGPPPADAGALPVSADGIVLVHAASFGAFRICTESGFDSPPLPTAELMPESNVVGVDVGSAVRLAPMTAPGKVWAVPVDDIGDLYPPGETGPDCKTLLDSPASANSVVVAELAQDLSEGVHLLVLRGCANAQQDPSATTARCGGGWTPADGNLALEVVDLPAYARTEASSLPVQVVSLLAPDLARRAEDRGLGVAFGDLGAAPPEPFVEGDLTFGVPAPSFPYALPYEPNDEAAYASSGFFVSIGGADGGARDVVLAQSLAEVQRLSAPRALPAEWYAAGSSYALLLLGGATQADAGLLDAATVDDRSTLHLLAVPVVAPADDAADASTD